jgi:hypothetical protein
VNAGTTIKGAKKQPAIMIKVTTGVSAWFTNNF